MVALNSSKVTACLVTRGDVDLDPILDSLIFRRVIVWDNSTRPDWKCAGRYWAALAADTEFVYWQDDDTIVPPETQQSLLDSYQPLMDIVANWGHGENPAGYDDLPLVCGGAVARTRSAWAAIAEYGARFPLDTGFMYEADFAVGVLYRDWAHVRLPFEIRDVAYNGRRLADQPWQRDLKLKITEQARAIRDTR